MASKIQDGCLKIKVICGTTQPNSREPKVRVTHTIFRINMGFWGQGTQLCYCFTCHAAQIQNGLQNLRWLPYNQVIIFLPQIDTDLHFFCVNMGFSTQGIVIYAIYILYRSKFKMAPEYIMHGHQKFKSSYLFPYWYITLSLITVIWKKNCSMLYGPNCNIFMCKYRFFCVYIWLAIP